MLGRFCNWFLLIFVSLQRTRCRRRDSIPANESPTGTDRTGTKEQQRTRQPTMEPRCSVPPAMDIKWLQQLIVTFRRNTTASTGNTQPIIANKNITNQNCAVKFMYYNFMFYRDLLHPRWTPIILLFWSMVSKNNVNIATMSGDRRWLHLAF